MAGVKMSSINSSKYSKAPRISGFKPPVRQLKATGLNIGGTSPHPSNKVKPVSEVDPAKKAKVPGFSKGGAVKKSGGCMCGK